MSDPALRSEDDARSFVAELADDAAMEKLKRLSTMLSEENEHQNLVASATMGVIWQRHFADSAQLIPHVSRETPRWLDLGSGAGFPGLVIAILRPAWPVRLVESRKRRIEWLERCTEELALRNCDVLGCRLEQVETFQTDVISARAFAPLEKLLSLSARFSTSETLWLLPKGRRAAQELAELPKWQQKGFHVKHSLTDQESGIIVGNLAQKDKNR